MADNRWTKKIECAFIPSPLRATRQDKTRQHPHIERGGGAFGWGCSDPRVRKPPFELWNPAISIQGRRFSGSIFRLSASLNQLTAAQTFLKASPPPEIVSRFKLVNPFAFHPLPTSHRLNLNTSWIYKTFALGKCDSIMHRKAKNLEQRAFMSYLHPDLDRAPD